MKKFLILFVMVAAVATLSSCGVNTAFMGNLNNYTTQVELGENNFKTVERVTGSAEVKYIIGIGGINRKQLYANAYANMLENTDLFKGSRALTNIVTEEQIAGVPPFYVRRTVTFSAHVIEFTE